VNPAAGQRGRSPEHAEARVVPTASNPELTATFSYTLRTSGLIFIGVSDGRADPARSTLFENLAARLTWTEVKSRGKCGVLPWVHSLSGEYGTSDFDQGPPSPRLWGAGRPSRISPTG